MNTRLSQSMPPLVLSGLQLSDQTDQALQSKIKNMNTIESFERNKYNVSTKSQNDQVSTGF